MPSAEFPPSLTTSSTPWDAPTPTSSTSSQLSSLETSVPVPPSQGQFSQSKSRTTIAVSLAAAALALILGAAGMLCWRRRHIAIQRQLLREKETLTAQTINVARDHDDAVLGRRERPPSRALLPPSSHQHSRALKATLEFAPNSSQRRPTEGTSDDLPPRDPEVEYETPTGGVEDGIGRTSPPGAQVVYEFDGGVRLAGGPPGRSGERVDVRGLVALPPPYRLFD
ncbi:hypothetical protein C8Q76DRAFT_796741 [Earliella scabrosa]|nr:hypothetical protein C8Q76DRAFT_796741 [Earliella scabrosa]